ncbi:MAG: VTT domain-containing protein [Candidatus Nanoarchaeia archaeon]|jgi:membrane protein DedA with SNARE-associated domain
MGFEAVIEYVMELIRTTGSLGVFIGVLIESVLAPIPSPLIIMAAGFIMLPANAGILEIIVPLLFTITLPGAIASTLGSYIGYGIGYYGGKPLIKKFEWLLGVSWDELDKAAKYFQKGIKDEIIIFLARAIPIMPLSVFSALAGVLRFEIKKFTLFTFLGTLVRVFVLGIIGWIMGSAYSQMANNIDSWEIIGYCIIALMVAVGIYYLYKNKKKAKK